MRWYKNYKRIIGHGETRIIKKFAWTCQKSNYESAHRRWLETCYILQQYHSSMKLMGWINEKFVEKSDYEKFLNNKDDVASYRRR